MNKDDLKEKIEATFGGCHCGYHGYLVLPDCEEEDHGDKCARCILKQLSKESNDHEEKN